MGRLAHFGVPIPKAPVPPDPFYKPPVVWILGQRYGK